ncbi:MAG: hypothetical protein KDE27_09930 [Planctomycetes bacterium]|nr:hypothetical protein [Planctomycetota bacterium]
MAQQPAGLLTGLPPAGLAQSSVGAGVGDELISRIPGEAYRGIGEYVPGSGYQIRGVVLRLRNGAPAEPATFDLHVYAEAGNTNRPTIPANAAPGTTALVSVLDVAMPIGSQAPEVTVVFQSPVTVPFGSDIFVSFVANSPNLLMQTLAGTSDLAFNLNNFDPCGPALAPGESYLLLHALTQLVELNITTIGWQGLVDLLVDGSSGVGVCRVNGASAPIASFYSGLHPDVADPPHHPGRHDVPGYYFRSNGTLPIGSPVFLLGSTDGFANGPFVVLSPGNAVLQLPLLSSFPLGMQPTGADGNALLEWPVPQAAGLRGLGVATQAFGFDLTNGFVRAGAAVRQRF